MAQYDWASCPAPVRAQIEAFCTQVHNLLGDDLVAIYLHGSLAMGCFNPERSDIDLLVIERRSMTVEAKYHLMDSLLRISNSPRPIETSFLVQSDIHPFRHPLPYGLHYSETWRERESKAQADGSWKQRNDVRKYDVDLSAHLIVTLHRGITLYGPPPSDILPIVPSEDYKKAIVGDYIDARDESSSMPVYFVLNACRIYAFIFKGYVLSKDEGGIYGLEHLPASLHPVIEQALLIYRGEGLDISFNRGPLDDFARYMDAYIMGT